MNHIENRNKGMKSVSVINEKLKKLTNDSVDTAKAPSSEISVLQYRFNKKYAGKIIDVDMIALITSMI
jgi:hypothetical protein